MEWIIMEFIIMELIIMEFTLWKCSYLHVCHVVCFVQGRERETLELWAKASSETEITEPFAMERKGSHGVEAMIFKTFVPEAPPSTDFDVPAACEMSTTSHLHPKPKGHWEEKLRKLWTLSKTLLCYKRCTIMLSVWYLCLNWNRMNSIITYLLSVCQF